MLSSPVVFTHYGDTPYLKRTLLCAKITNPGADIILLGDETNQETALSAGVRHVLFKNLDTGSLRQEFCRVFQPVCGKQHINYKNGGHWLRYVFERWFYVHEYVVKEGIENFWHFDSDTMILAPLCTFEQLFDEYDCTEQCNGKCMNGFVKKKALELYLSTINELFSDTAFLESQRREFELVNPHYAFTEMRAFVETKKRKRISSFHLSKVLDGRTFDDCISQDHGYETVRLRSGHVVKNLYWENGFHCVNKALNSPVRFNTLNLSWVPDFVFDWVLERVNRNADDGFSKVGREYLSSQSVPISLILRDKLKAAKNIFSGKPNKS